jgi:glyoxylase-like metal-dependent hydrolase (beta-lactamase superfamily II)
MGSILRLLVAVAILPSLTGCYYLHSEPVPITSSYDLDLAELRRWAASVPGPRPVELRRVLVATARLPGALMMAGASWEEREMTHVAFQVRYPDGSFLLLDSAQDREAHEGMPGAGPFDEQAWQDVQRALAEADLILISHEHADHIGGIARYPNPEQLKGRLRLNKQQLENRATLAQADLPEGLRAVLEPLEYADALAVAPGVVLKRAAGHTPGSQLVYVQLADGQELLYVGDVIWNRDALTELRYRPRFVTDWLLGEDRQATIQQLRSLRDLFDREVDVQIVIAHDARTHVHPAIRDGFVFESKANTRQETTP